MGPSKETFPNLWQKPGRMKIVSEIIYWELYLPGLDSNLMKQNPGFDDWNIQLFVIVVRQSWGLAGGSWLTSSLISELSINSICLFHSFQVCFMDTEALLKYIFNIYWYNDDVSNDVKMTFKYPHLIIIFRQMVHCTCCDQFERTLWRLAHFIVKLWSRSNEGSLYFSFAPTRHKVSSVEERMS